MSAFNFPNAPTEGQLFEALGGPTYVYHAPVWDIVPEEGSGGDLTVAWSEITGKPATFPPTLPIAWTDISGKPATFTPTLPIAQSGVTNLETDLAGKLPLAGGTMAGPILIGGTAAEPGIAAAADPTTGIFSGGTTLAFSVGGAQRVSMSTTTSAWTIKLTTLTPTTTRNGFNLPHATGVPASPTNGDLWTTSAGLFVQISSVTYQLATLTDLAAKANLAGATFTGKVTAPPSASGGAGLNMGTTGTAPSSPVDGDMWLVSGVFNVRGPSSTVAMVNLASTQTMTGTKTFAAPPVMATPTASIASLRLPHGVAPTTPTDGDVWSTSAGGFYGRANGVTKNLSIHVGTTAPGSPITNDLWLDTT